jgi:hypothetical protein
MPCDGQKVLGDKREEKEKGKKRGVPCLAFSFKNSKMNFQAAPESGSGRRSVTWKTKMSVCPTSFI